MAGNIPDILAEEQYNEQNYPNFPSLLFYVSSSA